MSSAGQDLLREVTAALWDLLDRCRAQAAAVLAGLGPEPGLAGTVLDGRLLQVFRPEDIAAADPGVSTLLAAFDALLPPGIMGDVTLHGFDPGDGQRRGLALAAVTPPPAVTVVAALTGAGSGLAFEIAAVGAGTFGPLSLDLLQGWSIGLTGDVAGGARLEFPRGPPPTVLDAGAPLIGAVPAGRNGRPGLGRGGERGRQPGLRGRPTRRVGRTPYVTAWAPVASRLSHRNSRAGLLDSSCA